MNRIPYFIPPPPAYSTCRTEQARRKVVLVCTCRELSKVPPPVRSLFHILSTVAEAGTLPPALKLASLTDALVAAGALPPPVSPTGVIPEGATPSKIPAGGTHALVAAGALLPPGRIPEGGSEHSAALVMEVRHPHQLYL